MKKTILITLFLCSISLFGQEENKTSQNNDVIESFMRLSMQQLFDTANYYFKRNSYDTTVICYNLLINNIPKNANIEQQKKLVDVYNRLWIIYFLMSDYRMAYDLSIKKLLFCEKYNLVEDKSITFSNIGIIYFYLNQYDMAEQYYLKSLELCDDSSNIMFILNNMGANNILRGKIDSSFFYIDKSMQISKRIDSLNINSMLNNLGSYYQHKKQYDSALYYFRKSLYVSRNKNDKKVEANNLSDIGKLFFEIKKIDSALYYLDLSNKIASENKYISNLAENYLALSEIEKSKGRFKNALEYYETYNNLKDSISNADVYSSVNLIQRQYEVSKTNQQIEELEIDRQLKENTIHYQRIIMNIIIAVSLLMGLVLSIIIVQNKRLRKSYNVLVDKNVEIVELYKKVPEIISENTQQTEESTQQVESENEANLIEAQNTDLKSTDENDQTSSTENEKYKNIVMSEQAQNELLNRILYFLENNNEIYNPDFTIYKMAILIHSNYSYISYIFNEVLKKNYNTFLNSYRMRKAQQLFSEPDTTKFTVEFVANEVGFKSRKAFDNAFKKFTGVTPAFYLKSLKDKKKNVAES